MSSPLFHLRCCDGLFISSHQRQVKKFIPPATPKKKENTSVVGFRICDAERYGVNEALVLSYLAYWIKKNEKNGYMQQDGHAWTHSSLTRLNAQFPFWSRKTMQRVVDSLVKQGAIIKSYRSGSRVQGGRSIIFALPL